MITIEYRPNITLTKKYIQKAKLVIDDFHSIESIQKKLSQNSNESHNEIKRILYFQIFIKQILDLFNLDYEKIMDKLRMSIDNDILENFISNFRDEYFDFNIGNINTKLLVKEIITKFYCKKFCKDVFVSFESRKIWQNLKIIGLHISKVLQEYRIKNDIILDKGRKNIFDILTFDSINHAIDQIDVISKYCQVISSIKNISIEKIYPSQSAFDYKRYNKKKLNSDEIKYIIKRVIGGLNGRNPFHEYLLKISQNLQEDNKTVNDVISLIKIQHKFWSTVLKHQMRKYDEMRSENHPRKRDYCLIHWEFDDLFRYCDDPVKEFDIDLHKNISNNEIDYLSIKFQKEIESKRKTSWTLIPITLTKFIFKFYWSLIKGVINLPFQLLFKKSIFSSLFTKTFMINESDRTKHAKKAWSFWMITTFAALTFYSLLIYYLINHLTQFSGVQFIVYTTLFCISQIFIFPYTVRTFQNAGRFFLSAFLGKKYGLAKIKTWMNVKKRFSEIIIKSNKTALRNYHWMINELYDHYYLSEDEYNRLNIFDIRIKPKCVIAQQRIKRWMNKYYIKEKGNFPKLQNWNDIKSLTVHIASLNEKFSYSWKDLITDEKDGQKLIISPINSLRKSYNDEWNNLIVRNKKYVNDSEYKLLKDIYSNLEILCSSKIKDEIVKWSNLKLLSLYNTLESVKKIHRVYQNYAEYFFPNDSKELIKEKVLQKIQVILTHDTYLKYSQLNTNKLAIDRYIVKNPEIELEWPTNLIHPSKSGAWTNIVSKIRGEIELELDSDHFFDIEEIAQLPIVIKRFDTDPKTDGICVPLYNFNNRHSLAAEVGSANEDQWAIQDSRVKSVVGGGGIYGKGFFRASAVLEKECIQPDSVAEDSSYTNRLNKFNSTIHFDVSMHLGHGQETTFEELKLKFAKFPTGTMETSLSKSFRDVLLSEKTPRYKKFELLHFSSHYLVTSSQLICGLLLAFGMALGYFPYLVFPKYFILGYLVYLIGDNFMYLLNCIENFGYIKGFFRFLKLFIPSSLMHSSFLINYLDKVVKTFRGFAKFTVAPKSIDESEKSWNETYNSNKFIINFGTVIMLLFLYGVIFKTLPLAAYILFFQFVISSFFHVMGPFFYTPRKNSWMKIIDLSLGTIYGVIRSIFDITIGNLLNKIKNKIAR